MSRKTKALNTDKFATVCANLLHKAFIDCARADAKQRFRTLDDGKQLGLARVKMEDGGLLHFIARLEQSEFRGSLNFGAFRGILNTLLARYAHAIEQKSPISVLTNPQTGERVIMLPGVGVVDGQTNVMVLGVDTRQSGVVGITIMFVDPAQFQAEQAPAEASA